MLNGTNAEHAQQVQALTAKLADFVTQAEQLSQSKLAAERQLQSEAAAREATQHQLETAEAAAVHADEAADSKIAEVAALKVCHLCCAMLCFMPAHAHDLLPDIKHSTTLDDAPPYARFCMCADAVFASAVSACHVLSSSCSLRMQEQLAAAAAQAQDRADSAMRQRAATLEIQRLAQENSLLAERLHQMETDVQVFHLPICLRAACEDAGSCMCIGDLIRLPRTHIGQHVGIK